MMTTTHLGALYVGRLLIGVANGFLMTFSQLWLQECSPARYRGFVVGAFTTAISLVGRPVKFTLMPWQMLTRHRLPPWYNNR